jgi:hypothetical protein
MRLPKSPALLLGLAVATATLATLARSASTPNSNLDSYVLMAVTKLRTTGLTVVAGNVGVNSGLLSIRNDFDAPVSQVAADTLEFRAPAGGCSMQQLFANFGTNANTPCGPGTPFTPPILGAANLDLGPACHFPTGQPACPANPLATFVDPGTTVSLPPGTYGDIVVRASGGQPGTLVFQGGDYLICGSILTDSGTKVVFNNSATLRVTQNIKLGDKSFTGGKDTQSVPAKNVRIFFSGRRINIRRRAEVRAMICAPEAQVRMDSLVTFEGQMAAFSIGLRQNVTVGSSGSIPGSTTTTTVRTTTTTIRSTTTTTRPQVCGNHVREGSEVCDAPDFGTATCPDSSVVGAFLTCTDNCQRIVYDNCPGFHATCGNGIREADEVCDPPDWGTATCPDSSVVGAFLTCADDCHRIVYDNCPGFQTTTTSTIRTTTTSTLPTCGNGRVDEGEVCDPPDWNGAACPGSSVVGAFLACVDGCTRIDTSQCPQQAAEVCGNCADDDGNGLSDFEDAACCAHRFPMVVGRGRLRAVTGTGTSRFRLRAVLARAGLARNIDPLTEDVYLQIRASDGRTDLLCAKLPATSFFAKRKTYRFRDPKGVVGSASGITRAVVRIRPNGTVRFTARGKQARLSNVPAGPLARAAARRPRSASTASSAVA